MSSSYRIRTELGVNKTIQVKLEQNFDTLELLSLTISPNNLYTRSCANYGVVVGRVFCNNGFGLPNVKLSIFIGIDDLDANDVIISTLYPYRTINDVNEDGYKYNLLPYSPSYNGHIPVGTFPDREDALINDTVIQVYDKYYKFTVSTNDSGDFMIFGVPPGQQTLFMQVDLSDIGEFSMTPQDLIRMGIANESQLDGTQFKFSTNYSELPQIVTISKTIQVRPFYGEQEICDYAIVRTDFDLTSERNVLIQPTAVFIGSIFSTQDELKVEPNRTSQATQDKNFCKVKKSIGEMCDLTTGPGQILAIRQTPFEDADGLPVLEEYKLENAGKIIDEDGAWVTEVPMNLNYVYTDEEGNRKISNNPKLGIPTTAKYRFKVKWDQSPQMSEQTKRAYFLVPNIKEYGWSSSDIDPINVSLYDSNDIITSPDLYTTEATLFSIVNQNDFNNYVYRINQTSNAEKLQIFYPDGRQYLSKNFVNGNTNFQIVWEKTDFETPTQIQFLRILKTRYRLEQSYAFSLDWLDYANIDDAILCKDTFMEMYYNKVYTVSQMIDRYAGGLRPSSTIQVKNIQDSKCNGTYNKFPTNDVFYRTSYQFVFYNMLMELIKYILLGSIPTIHVLAFFWLVLGPIIAVILWVVQVFIRGICSFLNWIRRKFNKAEKDCPPVSDFRSLIKNNPFLNINLALLLYTEDGCERCNCSPDGITADTGIVSQYTPYQDLQASILADTTSFEYYLGSPNVDFNPLNDTDYVPVILAGNAELPGVRKRTPFLVVTTTVATGDGDIEYNERKFSTSLPFSELLNKLNFDSYYFIPKWNIPNNQESGFYPLPRGIKVEIEPELNPNKYHYDSCMFIVLDEGQTFENGTILSFQDPSLSNDTNNVSVFNTTGTTGAISPNGVYNGENLVGYNVTVNWLNPNIGNPTNNTTTYVITADTQNNAVTYFPSDIEYFQVITTMDLGQIGVFNYNEYSMYNYTPYEINCMYKLVRKNSGWIDGYDWRAPINNLVQGNGMPRIKIALLMRGVDVHSPRVYQRIRFGGLITGMNGPFPSIDEDYVEGYYKLNIPKQYKPGLSPGQQKMVTRQNQLQTNNSVDELLSTIFYESYMFKYSNGFVPFTSDLHTYYSALDTKNFGNSGIPVEYTNTNEPGYTAFEGNMYITENGYLQVGSNNFFTADFVGTETCPSGSATDECGNIPNSPMTYFTEFNAKESVNNYPVRNGYNYGFTLDGGSVYQFKLNGWYSVDENCSDGPQWRTEDPTISYFSPSYRTITPPPSNIPVYNSINFNNRNKIVVRSERMPTSTSEDISGPNSFQMHQNSKFAVFSFTDTGNVTSLTNVTQYPTQSDNESSTEFVPYSTVLESVTSCEKAVTLACYDVDTDGNPSVAPNFLDIMEPDPGKIKYFKYGTGCYNLVSRAFASLPKDLANIFEWTNRNKISNAACMDVFSHSYSNSWINGTLFAYPFQNKRLFDIQNRPYSVYCKDTIYLHETSNNFYYRSSPYSVSGRFIGRDTEISSVGNQKYLQSPTTIMDLGPKASFIQEIVNTDEYDGYIVSKLPSTSFKDVSELFNLYILSRIIKKNFWEGLLTAIIPDIVTFAFFYNQRWSNGVSVLPGNTDGDYSQMISINSEFGITEFNISNYAQPADSAYQPIYFSNTFGSPIFGVFLTGNTQDRDYISPRRTIIVENASVTSPQYYYYVEIPTKTQTVPFYQWNLIDEENIFGDKNNNWKTEYPSGSGNYSQEFFNYEYQKMDRINPASRYFKPDGINASNFRGTIINFENGLPTKNLPSGYDEAPFTVGDPFHFYFGLKKGASAMDKFRIKYVNTEEIIE
jgi:hypothetical protein